VEFDEYVAARYGRLIEHAVLLGCPEGEAGTYVDRVLLDQRRAIRRADDPDPAVRAALEHALSGQPKRQRRSGPLAALGLVAVAALVGGVVLGFQPDPGSVTMPSLFGYDGDQATQLLEQQGFSVQVDAVRGCEPVGVVVNSVPVAGAKVERGATVTVQTALPTDEDCLTQYRDRVDAWGFVRFALGGPVPALGVAVRVIDASTSTAPLVLSQQQADDPAAWGRALTLLGQAARLTTSAPNGMATLRTSSETPPAHYCGWVRPTDVQQRVALRITIDTNGDGESGCPLTLDLYRRDGVIDTVVVYPVPD
jgi:hypothetical protein